MEHLMVVLGDEYDQALRMRLMEVLRQMGASQDERSERYLAGSQEWQCLVLRLGDSTIRVELETYVGLTLWGPVNLVQDIAAQVQAARADGRLSWAAKRTS